VVGDIPVALAVVVGKLQHCVVRIASQLFVVLIVSSRISLHSLQCLGRVVCGFNSEC